MDWTSPTSIQWPALATRGALPEDLTYERGIWGKVHGVASDFRWIATTPAFSGRRKRVETQLRLGAEDQPARFGGWRVRGNACYAVVSYPSTARDAAGRLGFIEKQILEWQRSADVPAAFGAFLLLARAAMLDASTEHEEQTDARWKESEFSLELDSDPPLEAGDLAGAIRDGLTALTTAVERGALAEMYAGLLAGNRAITIAGLTAEPLPFAAIAALLLPLPREIADRMSVSAWFPSSRLTPEAAEDIRGNWDVVAGSCISIDPIGSPPSQEQIEIGRAMATAVFEQDPAALLDAAESADQPLRLALWGPSASGKTVLLANLYLQTDDSEWDVFPTQKSADFVRTRRNDMRTRNVFPPATTGVGEAIEYLFRHRTKDLRAVLAMEDRAGVESEKLREHPRLREHLKTADGLVLLFDPVSDLAQLAERVWWTLEQVHVEKQRDGDKDPRPIAVCVSKADLLIETAADFCAARDSPDVFVRSRVPREMIHALDRFCSRYKLFPVSATGVRLRHGVIEPSVFYDEMLQRRLCTGGRTFNLMTPFTWLIECLTGTPA